MDVTSGEERVVEDTPAQVTLRCREVESTPVESFLHEVETPRIGWATSETAIAAGGATEAIRTAGPGRIASVRAVADRLLASVAVPEELPRPARPRLFGGFAFHRDHDEAVNDIWSGFPGAYFVLPAIQLTVTDAGAWLTATASGDDAGDEADARLDRWAERLAGLSPGRNGDPPGIEARRPTTEKREWNEQVRSAVESVREGRLRKVVLAQALSVDLAGAFDIPATLARLGRSCRDCYRFLFQPPDARTFFGATPERLVELEGRTVRTTALAGSTGRGETTEEDDWLAAELRDSEKDAHEHALVVEAIRDQLEPVAEHVSTGGRTVRRLPTVQHLQTPIRASLPTDAHVLSVVEALHPTPAVGGLPPDEALRTIRETETFDRGWYAAPFGWVDAAGDGTFAVGIRSAVAEPARATLFAGDGIVADSDPDREWDELQLKYRPILDELE
ncbi:MAG: isochorismate synthase [Haloarculaceae archaeon]